MNNDSLFCKDGHFIPITRFAIIDHLRRTELGGTCDQKTLEDLLHYLTAWRHQTYRAELLRMKEIYLPFSPDRDTVRIIEYSDQEMSDMKKELIEKIEWLMGQANYTKIAEKDLNKLLSAQSAHGLSLTVDVDEYEDLVMFCRGAEIEKLEKRSWKTLYLHKVTYEVPIFLRLFLLIKLKPERVRIHEIMEKEKISELAARRHLKHYRKLLTSDISSPEDRFVRDIMSADGVTEIDAKKCLKKYSRLLAKPTETSIRKIMISEDMGWAEAGECLEKYEKLLSSRDLSNFVYLKVFKNIPQDDIEMMFPNTDVRFKLFDKIKLGLTTGSGVVVSVFSAISGGGAAVGGVVGVVGGVLAIPYAIATALIGLAAVIFRQVTHFFTQRSRYMMVLARRLYFHSLADNRGALTLMIDRAEEEDAKEDMLLYYFLVRQSWPRDQLTELDQMIEKFLEDEFKVQADFDIHDAVERLEEDGLIFETPEGLLEALPPKEACLHLKKLIHSKLLSRDAQ